MKEDKTTNKRGGGKEERREREFSWADKQPFLIFLKNKIPGFAA